MKLEGCHRDQELTALAVDSEGGRILTGARDGIIKVDLVCDRKAISGQYEIYTCLQVWDSLTGESLQSLETPGATEVVSILHNPERRRFLATGWNRQVSVFEDKVSLDPAPLEEDTGSYGLTPGTGTESRAISLGWRNTTL